VSRGDESDVPTRLRERLCSFRGVVLDADVFAALVGAFSDDLCEAPTDNVVYAFLLELRRLMGERFILYSYEELQAKYAEIVRELADERVVCDDCPASPVSPTVRGLCHLFRSHKEVRVPRLLSRSGLFEQLERLYRELLRAGCTCPPEFRDFKHDFVEGRAGDEHVHVANVLVAAVKRAVLVTSDRRIKDVCDRLKPGCLCIRLDRECVRDPTREELRLELAPELGGLPSELRYRRVVGGFAP